MSIDINQPVQPGHDMVLNYEDGTQKLGTAEGQAREMSRGKLIGKAPNNDVEEQLVFTGPVETPDNPAPVDEGKQGRAKNGRFASK